jgi:hypothetical protein
MKMIHHVLQRFAGSGSGRTFAILATAAALLLMSPYPVSAADPEPAVQKQDEGRQVQDLEERVRELEATLAAMKDDASLDPDALKELERRMEILSREIETLRIGEAAVEATDEVNGMGPAASKIYRTEKGVSIGGYGEMLLESFADEADDGTPVDKSDRLDFLRAVIYLGYKFNDHILFNSEIEFEHASTGKDGEVSVEFAYLDFMFRDAINARVGLLLVPMGFINELHEPPIFLGARRPDIERRLIPTTWRENGAGVFGDLGPVTYRAYVLAGLDGAGIGETGFTAEGLRGGRQSGSKSLAEDFAFVARADWEIIPGLMLGGSFYTGNSGQGAVTTGGETIDARTDILDVHLQWRWRGVELRALWVDVSVDQADLLNDFQGFTGMQSVGEELSGHYLQAGYDVLATLETQQAVIPFVRYETFDTQKAVPTGFVSDPVNDVKVMTYGVSYKPIPKVVIKLDFQDYDNAAGTGVDQWNLAAGFLF